MKLTKRHRDNQHWLMDVMVKQTGRFQNFAYDQRVFPPEVKSLKMIPHIMERYARHREEMARAAEKAGHFETAAELFWLASEKYRLGQHAIIEPDNQEKIYLHGKQLECYQKVIEHSRHPIEIVEIPFEDNYIQGILHLVPGKKKAPTVLFIPGMDMTKEAPLNPFRHPFIERGMNCLQIDGPGQGTSNIRKIHVTLNNYERAGTAALNYLQNRDEVNPDKLAVSGYSFGSYWGMQIAAVNKCVKAFGTAAAMFGPMTPIFEEETPHFKQTFMYMAGIEDEEKFDQMASQMTLKEYAEKVKCPCLVVTGEFDPLAPINDVLNIFDELCGPKELWVVEDEFHTPRHGECFGSAEFYGFLADWIGDALNGKYPQGWDRRVIVQKTGVGPYGIDQPYCYLPQRIGKKNNGHTDLQLGPRRVGNEKS